MVDRFEKKSDVLSITATATDRTAYSAASGSTQPLKMSAQAVSPRRTREDSERGGAPAEADAATAPTEPIDRMEHVVEKCEEFEAELAALRAKTSQAQRFMDHTAPNLNLSADELERMNEEIGDMRTAQGTLKTFPLLGFSVRSWMIDWKRSLAKQREGGRDRR
jgi:hypothetical protein